MRSALLIAFASALSVTICQSAAQEAKPNIQDLAPLTDDLSRQDLFAKVIGAELPTATSATEFPIPPDFYFPQDVTFDKIAGKPRGDVIFGIDVSHHTSSKLDLSLLKLQRVDFVYAKATQGTGFKDPAFGKYWKALAALPEASRPLRGAYHFLSANISGEKQADTFVDFLTANGGLQKGDMPPCLDLEWDVVAGNPDQWKGTAPAEILQQVRAWLERVKQRTGRTPMIYTARAWWRERNIPESELSKLGDFPIWIADYSKSHKATEIPANIAGKAQDLWQFADNAKLTTGYAGGTVDANIFYGSPQHFRERFGLSE